MPRGVELPFARARDRFPCLASGRQLDNRIAKSLKVRGEASQRSVTLLIAPISPDPHQCMIHPSLQNRF